MRTDPIRAWRCWRYGTRTGHLESTIRSTLWLPCERLTAQCLCGTAGSIRCKHAPNEDCSCGIYAWLDRADLHRLVRIEDETVPVWGEVSLWGDIVQHERGVRAQYAYPYALYMSAGYNQLAAKIRNDYCVDVTEVPLPTWSPLQENAP